ncbi:peptide deformylase [Limnofasciculus baicalensis]|uniref:Peptide deformylase n=1 Tax=Limnofasciculus baicalensis BBK-W-15 TaxID=2699891 RepID=A0AAE3GWP2_9CYAN|nr:peptide deformylase [Limnofasciculus baicalensis]MCP2731148.1 peptide deformylase [Limnofasciculus baicalensis BBK-W-15]
MTQSLEIAQLGNPILRQQAQLIDNIQAVRFQQLIDALIVTAISKNGVGIAAPQVSASYRLFIVASRPNPRYPNAPEMEPTAMINPRIIAHSDEIVKDWEGCLSVPGMRGLVPRYQKIEVEYSNRDGKLRSQELTDFVARIFQHEYDHLEGIMFLDRVECSQNLIKEQEYQERIVQKYDASGGRSHCV